ncbi:MarR family transcriptional regulator [Candidatus Njordibacter sp. Uisw_056]|jgi:DNA-binding MarR family transcriptional regulator|uniref:MarR family winged helix-turn-helix transcriptional regulator n=1 Tax=Candidatus Njordibacter sp. Uisw_056 TaxID=3230973 RepID=UPI003D421C66
MQLDDRSLMPIDSSNVSLNLDRFLPYRLNRLAHKVGVSLATIYTDAFGISRSQWRVIALLGQHQRLTAKQICTMTHMDKVKVSRAVNGLVKLNYLQTTPDKADKRAVLLTQSVQGKELFQVMVPKVQAWEEDFLKKLSAQEISQLATIIDKLDPSNEY